MELTNERATGKSSRLPRDAEGANLARRNQMKLSGKKDPAPTKLWKVLCEDLISQGTPTV